MLMPKRIIFTGGGTVGHVTLNLILMPYFIKDGWEVHYIGDKNGIEYKEVQKSGLAVTFHSIKTGKLRRYFSWQNLIDVFKVGVGLFQSLIIISKVRPKAVFSKGGFVSVPPVIAAKLLGLPVFIHESDISMGLANKIASKFATTMYTTFEPGTHLKNAKHIGAVTKVRELPTYDSDECKKIKAYFDPSLKTLLFIGGSAGAKVFNQMITQTPALTEHFNVINISGDTSLNTIEKNLYRVDYVTDLYQPLMSLADIVVTRGGSNTLFELLAMRKLHVIVPLGKEASRGDQIENADYFVKKGYSRQIKESDLSFEKLRQEIDYLIAHRDSFVKAMSTSQEITPPDRFYDMLVTDLNSKIKED
ncbi:UDP-N-acetylglucosamine--N-acetylmuramyl-(pentapeptide) pyrophosphoryl-undecaprenol N-acetylglucosamine transferase [Streptococcus porcinus]|nr:UDP-N-acetylglucosamine--N-acetylmuramyl-(pentapeptide) pyrophosphoryl-undecaprenol N-acetylglucosamine transferase [Streptococcus porcinus]